MPIRIVLFSEDPLVVTLLADRLGREPDLAIVGAARRVKELEEDCRRTSAEVALLDAPAREEELERALRDLGRAPRPPAILVIGRNEADESQAELFRSGANGYLPRENGGELPEAIRAVAAGEIWLTQSVSGRLLQEHQRLVRRNRGAGFDRLARLTARERDVLYQVAKGLTNQQAGEALGMSVNTVKLHLRNILRKLDVPSRVEAAVVALQEGLLDEPES